MHADSFLFYTICDCDISCHGLPIQCAILLYNFLLTKSLMSLSQAISVDIVGCHRNNDPSNETINSSNNAFDIITVD